MRVNLEMPRAIVAYAGGHVQALDPLTGQTIWSTNLPKAYKTSIGTVLIDGDMVLAGVGGRVYCLDITDGRLIWVNELPGMGFGMVALATPVTSADGPAQSAQQAANAQAASAAAIACVAATAASS
jgi:outer membrane protein assembly factor BamB